MRRKDFKKVVVKLKRKFELIEDPQIDHLIYDIRIKGIYITKIKNSNSPKDYQDQLMAGDLHISRTQLQQFIDCTFSNDDLINQFKKRQIWPAGL